MIRVATSLGLGLGLAACWRGEVTSLPPPSVAAAPPSERLATTPIDRMTDQLDEDQHLEVDGSPWREVAIMHRDWHHSLVVATQAGRFAMPLDSRDGLIVDELALRPLVPRARPWVVVIYNSIHDGGKTTILVACQPGPGDNPECTHPLEIEESDLRDAPNWRIVYPTTGGFVLEPIGGGVPRRFSL